MKLKLGGQPFQILTILLEQPGEVVTREEFQKRLWPDTFVDVDHNLNTAINKIREVLGDSAEIPRFVETLPRRGYRFIAPVNGPSKPREVIPVDLSSPQLSVRNRSSVTSAGPLLAGAILLAFISVAVIWWVGTNRVPRIANSKRLTFTGQVMGPLYPFATSSELYPSLATDGSRVYYTSLQQSANRLSYVSLSGGDQMLMSVPLYADLRHISPDRSTLLVYGHPEAETEHLWFVPTAGAGAHRISNIDGHDGAWSPDGRRIVFASGFELFVADSDGANSHRIATTLGKALWLRWSPDSAQIRFTVLDQKTAKPTLWECGSDGTDLRKLSFLKDDQWEECCGDWTKDGRYFFFRTHRENRADIWAIRETSFAFRLPKPVRLTAGPLDSIGAIPSSDGKQLLALAAQPRSELHRLDLKTHQLFPYLPGISIGDARPIPGGKWIAYIEGHGNQTKVWQSRPDGSERLQLTTPPLYVFRLTPSPDGKQIALVAKMLNQPWRIYLVPLGGGPLRAVTPEDQNATDPTWSPDGRSLLFGGIPDVWAESSQPKHVSILNLETGQTANLPGSDGLFSPRWSPDGHYIVAMTRDFGKLMLFDLATKTWTELARGVFDFPEWHPDSQHVYVNEYPNGHIKLMRIQRTTGKQEEVLNLESVNPNASVCWMIVPPQETSLLVSCTLPGGDIYAHDLELP
jgi:Tol biopolymer transport system component/DNA-binding winged helix-turn-helix (wHTH) protein